MVPFGESRNRIRIDSGSKQHKRRQYLRLLNAKINNVVINLSQYQLTFAETNILNRGLGFVPAHLNYSTRTLITEMDRFERKLQLFFHFRSTAEDSNDDCPLDITNNLFRPKSTWLPKKTNAPISCFVRNLHADISAILKRRPLPNLTKFEISALNKLRDNRDITIKPADKGGGICVLDTSDYETKICTMLNDTSVYTPVSHSDHMTVKDNADRLLTALYYDGFITEKQLRYLTDFSPRCPIFYGLPKVHKRNIPLRPIVSQINAPTCMVNEIVDKLLTVAEQSIPNLFQDTTAFLNLIETHKHVKPNTLLITMDVVALYTNIPHEEGIAFVSEFYEETICNWGSFDPGLRPIPTSDLITLMRFILQNCTFQFAGQLFCQKYGTTMGARFSVKFANIYMHVWFRKYLASFNGLTFDFIGRLIDDVFTLWPYGKEAFDRLFAYLNNCHPTIKFEADISSAEVHFLDTFVTIQDDVLHTRVYTKPTDKKQFLFYSSCHPLHVKNAIPYSQAIRYRRNTDDDPQLQLDLQTLAIQFKSRGYPNALIADAIRRVNLLDRSQTLSYTSHPQKRSKFNSLLGERSFLPLIVTYFEQFSTDSLIKVLKSRWTQFLATDYNIRQIFEREFPLIVFKRGKTIGSVLTSTNFRSKTVELDHTVDILAGLLNESDNIPKVTRCNRHFCKCCNCIVETSSFSNSDGDLHFDITDNFSCNSSHLIYVISCVKCHKQYVGLTDRALKERLNNHRSDIKLSKPTAVGLHFNLPDHTDADLRILPIQDLLSVDTPDKFAIENYWMRTLNSIYPFGMNNNPLAKL